MDGFENLSAIGVAERLLKEKGETKRSVRFYMLSFALTADMFGASVRSHWYVENQLHWSLDVNFHDDASRIRKGYGAENRAMARRIALNLLKNNGDNKKSLRVKRKLAGWDKSYLKQIIGF